MIAQVQIDPQKRCITPGCDRQKHIRGLCASCYIAARRMIADRKTTWEELESLGLSRTPQGRGLPSAFVVAYQQAKAKAGKKQAPKRRAAR